MRVLVKPVSGEFAIDMENGQRLYEQLVRALSDSPSLVEVDFDGVQIYATPFLNAAIGQLLSTFSADLLRERLEFKNMADHGLVLVKRVVDNAKGYYSNERHRKLADEMQSDDTEEGP